MVGRGRRGRGRDGAAVVRGSDEVGAVVWGCGCLDLAGIRGGCWRVKWAEER